ncbi:SIS domain-containing protein [Streptomyces sp. NPDC050433]|uniref:D-sedoheptulose-7-phosphate isomerase n=1 Tax=unclassified Streptomyces TaxID=2593676 RepID=UPI003422245E
MTNATAGLIDQYVRESARALTETDTTKIEQVVGMLLDAYHRKSTVYTVGNGGSASTAAHFAADLGKFATGGRRGFRSLDLTGNVSSLTAWTNDEEWGSVYENILAPYLEPYDVVVAFSVHGGAGGWSDNLLRALQLARSRGAGTIGFAGDGGGRFLDVCDVTVVVPQVPDHLITPVTESLHVSLFHLLCACTRQALAAGPDEAHPETHV